MKNTLSMKRSYLTGSILIILLLALMLAAGCPSTKSKEQIELAKTNALDPSSGATSQKVPGVAADRSSISVGTTSGASSVGAAIEVFGSSEQLVIPDTVIIDLDVTTRAKNAVNAKDSNNQIMEKVTAAALKFGVPKNKIKTLGFSISPEYNYENDKQTLVGYVASNIIEVTYSDLDKSGDLIDLLVNTGATGVSSLRFTVEDPSEVKANGIILAVNDAKIKAGKLAKENGLKIIGIYKIIELDDGGPIMFAGMARDSVETAEKSSVPISAGENKISSRVQVIFSIE